MARFLAVVLAAAALLAAGRIGHAAPSTAEVFWRAVLKSSVVPDAILRRLRTDTSFVSKGMAGMAKGTGRSTSDLDYDDYTRLPPTAGKAQAAPFGHDYKAPSEGTGTREDDGPFGYDYKAPSEANKARDDDDDDVPFNYDYKVTNEPGNERTSPSKAGKEMVGAPYNYGYKAPSEHRVDDGATASEARGGGEATSESKASNEIVGAPYNYGYTAPSKRRAVGVATASEARGGRKATTTVFFHEEAVSVGERLHFRFPAAAPAPLGLLPRHVADSVPFSTPALPSILALFGFPPGSAQAAGVAETLRTCEWPPLAGESKFCASSLEALVERAMATLGTRDVRAVTSMLPRAGAPLQPYTVRAVRRVDSASFVACHDEVYPYTVYRCHTTGPARAYMIEMEGANGTAITVATVCHTDTSRWNPEHLSFKLLGTKPGGAPICHLMPYGHIIWAENVKSSPA